MASPKEWFRRRRPNASEEPDLAADPFAGEATLELGRAAMLAQSAMRDDESRVEGQSPIPPPARPEAARRTGRVIERSAFAVHPELRRREERVKAGREDRVASFAPRRNALFRIDPPSRPAAPARPPAPPSGPAPRILSGSTNEDEGDPRFTIAAPGNAWRRSEASLPESSRRNALLRDAFTPTRPKQGGQLFSGRAKQLQRIIAAIEEERAHVVVYGERGSGKTSLSNLLAAKAEEAGYHVLRFACSTGIAFEDIFRDFLRRIPASFLAEGLGSGNRSGVDNFEELLSDAFTLAELVAVCERIHDRHVIMMVDEWDRVTNEEAKSKLAEFIKIMSDRSAPVTLVLIGVADDVRQLFGKHPSLQRTLITVPMPLMTRREIEAIIAAGEDKSGLKFAGEVHEGIADFAQGLPYHAHLLSLFAARSAVRRKGERVELQDLRYAIERAAEEAEPRVKDAYDLAVGAHQEQNSFRDVLFYAARCRTDEFGVFGTADVAEACRAANQDISLLSLQYPLKKLTEPDRGAVLRRIVSAGGLRYQFSSQMMRHYVLARQAAQRGLI